MRGNQRAAEREHHNPSNNAAFAAGANLTISAIASDSDGAITK